MLRASKALFTQCHFRDRQCSHLKRINVLAELGPGWLYCPPCAPTLILMPLEVTSSFGVYYTSVPASLLQTVGFPGMQARHDSGTTRDCACDMVCFEARQAKVIISVAALCQCW
uniref:Integron gene cassette protein n=1 Tax=Panagrellus redivivus TaxID=6233 RepID=A0A7E4ZR05_PANRE